VINSPNRGFARDRICTDADFAIRVLHLKGTALVVAANFVAVAKWLDQWSECQKSAVTASLGYLFW
jgi:hypothetical protein